MLARSATAITPARESCRTASARAGLPTVSTSASCARGHRRRGPRVHRADGHVLPGDAPTPSGQPQCSYKGGDPGFVRVLDERTLAFPNYDGNGMYLSMGNVLVNPQVGMLFIDFVSERPSRLRLEGTASIDEPTSCWEYPGAQFVVRVRVHARVSELPALHPPHGARRALRLRAAQRAHDAGARVEARRARRGRAAAGRPGRRSARDIALPSWHPSARPSRRSRPRHRGSAGRRNPCTAGRSRCIASCATTGCCRGRTRS